MKILVILSIVICLLIVGTAIYLLKGKTTSQIGIIAALPQELDVIINSLKNKKIIKLHNKKIYKGKIDNTDVLVMLGDMGKVNASISSQLLISNFKLDLLIVTGLAGGLNLKYEIGDVVIAEEVFQHDHGFLGKNGLVTHAIGTMPEIDIGTNQKSFIKKIIISPDIGKYIKLIQSSLTSISINNKNREPQIYMGTIATGDQFIANDKRKNELIELGADLVEMEGAAIAEVAFIFNVPIIIIRTISDKAGSEAKFDFPAFIDVVSKNNAKTIIYLLQSKKLMSLLK